MSQLEHALITGLAAALTAWALIFLVVELL